jgi:hypothetical protein
MTDGDDRPPFAAARGATAKLGRQVRVLRPGGDGGDLGQYAPPPGGPAACPPTAVSTTTLGMAGLPGHIPAQEARCSAEGKRERSAPISARPRAPPPCGGRHRGWSARARGPPAQRPGALRARRRPARWPHPGAPDAPDARAARAARATGRRGEPAVPQPSNDRLGQGVPLGPQLLGALTRPAPVPVHPSRPRAAAAGSRAPSGRARR